VLSRGLLSGASPRRRRLSRALAALQRRHQAQNQDVVERIAGFAKERGLSSAELCIAWVLAKQPGFVPVIGARRVTQLSSALNALKRPLSQADVAALEQLVPAQALGGTRYDERQMAHLDSER
jgi:aryl-alcohol dehydrogenase-like predicted oxidoreductase